MTKEKQHHKIEWFDKLRLNSWEVEILIVGFVLVMLFQLPDTLAYEASRIWNSSELDSEYSFLITGSQGFTFLTICLCVQILIYSFSIYLALRGFWVGILGLSSVYPDGINLKKLNFNDKFISIIKKYNFNQFIISVDNICSTIFSFSFLLSFSIISLLIFCFQLFLLIMSIATLSDIFPQGSIYEAIIEILLIVYIVFGLIFFIDHFFFSVFKKIKWKFLKIPFYYINRFYHYATLVFIYDQLYYAFISNIKKRIILFVFFCYIAFTSFFEPLNEYYFFPEAGMVSYDIMQYFYYEDEFINIEKGDEEAFPEEPFINSTIITSNY